MRFLVALALLTLPAQAEDCFAGQPKQVTYDNGRVVTIIQRHGDDLTYTVPYEGFQDSVSKTHLMLFPKQSRQGARSTEYRWTSALPHLDALVPGFQFDLNGTMKIGDGKAVPYRNEGEVLGRDTVLVGECPYDVLVIRVDSYLDDALLVTATDYLSPDMRVLLKSETVSSATGAQTVYVAVALQ